MDPFRVIGMLYVELEKERAEHLKTLAMLSAVVNGKFDPRRIEMKENGWSVRTEEPAVANGS